MTQPFDVIVLGAGAAGLHCAGIAGQRGLRVLLIDHAAKVAEKIRISGGGRCNFTNTGTAPANFLSDNPDFCRSALARYTPTDFIALLRRHGVGFHEKHKGQLFCDQGSGQIIDMLLAECAAGQVTRWQPCTVAAVRTVAGGFEVDTSQGPVSAAQLVVATGGLSIPAIGASDFGHRLARQFGHTLVEPRPALVPLTFDATDWAPLVPLAGVALPVQVRNSGPTATTPTATVKANAATTGTGTGTGTATATAKPAATPRRRTGNRPAGGDFLEDLLFTHRGLSGPAILQISSYWRPGQALQVDLAPGHDLPELLLQAKQQSRRQLGNQLADWLPQRLSDAWLARLGLDARKPMPELRDRDLALLAESLSRWTLTPSGTEGWRKAEVTAGGVDTRELDSRTLASRRVPGLHFIGEVVDVTGWLGGYNFQWAWASAFACAEALTGADHRAIATR